MFLIPGICLNKLYHFTAFLEQKKPGKAKSSGKFEIFAFIMGQDSL